MPSLGEILRSRISSARSRAPRSRERRVLHSSIPCTALNLCTALIPAHSTAQFLPLASLDIPRGTSGPLPSLHSFPLHRNIRIPLAMLRSLSTPSSLLFRFSRTSSSFDALSLYLFRSMIHKTPSVPQGLAQSGVAQFNISLPEEPQCSPSSGLIHAILCQTTSPFPFPTQGSDHMAVEPLLLPYSTAISIHSAFLYRALPHLWLR